VSGEFNLTGSPDTPAINIALDGNAAFNVDAAALEAFEASMEPGTTPDMTAIMSALPDVLRAIDAELTLNIGVPAEAGLPVDTVVIDASLVDGVGYLNFDELDKVAGGALAEQGMTGWMGIDFAEVTAQFLEQNAAMIEQMGAQMGSMGSTTAMMGSMEQYEFAAKYVTITRTDGGSGDAEFTTSIDFGGLFADPELATIIKEQAATSGQTMTDAQLQQSLAMMQMVAPGLTMEAVQRIDPATSLTTHSGFTLKFDMAMLVAMMGQGGGSGPSEMTLALNFDFSGQNATTVSAPAGAQVVPTETVLQMLMGGASR
jgi:hypothetical protein